MNKNEYQSFAEFTNKGIVIRSYDSLGVLLLFVNNDLEHAGSKGPYIISIDKRSVSIKHTDLHLMTDTSNVDTSLLNRLALKFIDYDVQKLSVDKKGNVYVGLRSNERVDLVRFSELQYKTNIYEKWKHVKDNWYEHP